jgi:hypothetical protein
VTRSVARAAALREKTQWKMLYESAARADEALCVGPGSAPCSTVKSTWTRAKVTSRAAESPSASRCSRSADGRRTGTGSTALGTGRGTRAGGPGTP